jgi:hypothetical protein
MHAQFVVMTMALGLLAGSQVLPAATDARSSLLGQRANAVEPITFAARRDDGAEIPLRINSMQVFSADAEFIVVGANGEQRHVGRPDTRFYRVRGPQDSGLNGVLAIPGSGEEFGLIRDGSGFQQLRFDSDGAITLNRIDAGSGPADPFRCANNDASEALARDPNVIPVAPELAEPDSTTAIHTARIAIETDNELLDRFSGNTTTATNYIGSLIGFISTIYDAEVQTNLQVSFLRLWTTPDPFVQTTPACLMLESGKYWNDNQAATSRTTMHFLSGKNSLAGIAWVGVLCSGPFMVSQANVGASCAGLASSDNFGGAYGVTEGISGNFNAGNPNVVWDVDSVAHELGHNFNSPHTHCYGGIGGSPDPIDQCYNTESGCYSGTAALPGPAGQGSGTIMSYCQLRSPGLSNISLTLGTGHPFGVLPGRVPSRMFAHVQSRAGSSPSCLALQSVDLIFANGFD